MKRGITRKFYVECGDGQSWARRQVVFYTRQEAESWFRLWRMGYEHLKGRIIEVTEKIHTI